MILSRDEILGALYSLGLFLPPKTSVSDDVLISRLNQALDSAQEIESYLSNAIFDPSIHRKWSIGEGDKLEDAFARGLESLESGSLQDIAVPSSFSAFKTTFVELVQTLVEVAANVAEGKNVVVIQDQEQKSCIALRVVDTFKLTPRDVLSTSVDVASAPAFTILFEHSTRAAPSHSTLKFLKKHRFATAPDPLPQVPSSVEEQKLFLHILLLNASRLSKSYNPARDENEGGFELSFVLPLKVAKASVVESTMEEYAGGCVLCGEKGRVSRCSQCHAVAYCSRICQTDDWKHHKKLCKLLKGGKWRSTAFLSSICHQPNIHGDLPFLLKFWFEPGDERLIRLRDRTGSLGGQLMTSGEGFEDIRALLTSKGNLPSGTTTSESGAADLDHNEDDIIQRKEAHIEELSEEAEKEDHKNTKVKKVYLWARRIGSSELTFCVDRFPDSLGSQLDW